MLCLILVRSPVIFVRFCFYILFCFCSGLLFYSTIEQTFKISTVAVWRYFFNVSVSPCVCLSTIFCVLLYLILISVVLFSCPEKSHLPIKIHSNISCLRSRSSVFKSSSILPSFKRPPFKHTIAYLCVEGVFLLLYFVFNTVT